jgi:steroid 5-alpha reductase family enzyme
MKDSKAASILICLIAYLIAGAAAFLIYLFFPDLHEMETVIYADMAATIIIFIFSVVLNNSSMYDPYWSVIPPFIALFWFFQNPEIDGIFSRKIILVVLISLWGIRLTANWLSRWNGLRHEDWRYVNFRNSFPKLYWLVSFSGIHFFPTIIVFFACLPVLPVMQNQQNTLNVIDFLGYGMISTAILIQLIADTRLTKFIKSKPPQGTILDAGIWRLSRHPNYLGEILFWWGIYVVSLAASGFIWWAIIGPVAMTLMFLFISIPMIEKRMLEGKPEWNNYKKKVPVLIPWFKKSVMSGENL